MPDPEAMTDDLLALIQQKTKQRLRQARGRAAEQVVEHRLRFMGLVLVEKVEVGVKVISGRRIYTKPVSGDFRAVVPGSGKSVLVEVKVRDESRLACSDLEPHQRALLSQHHQAGGCSILAWMHQGKLAMIEWFRVEGSFAPRQSLSWLDAIELMIPPTHRITPP